MSNKEHNTEKKILQAAEDEFMEHGYDGAKMLSIAKRADVSHSMLHYYFRTKDKLFQMIFINKVQTVADFLQNIFDKKLSFDDTVRLIVETQFNFIAQNPKLPLFIIKEVISNKGNRKLLIKTLKPKIEPMWKKISDMFEKEVAKGNIRPISYADFIMNVIALNTSSFIGFPVLKMINGAKNKTELKKILAERCESNVQFILHALKP